MNIFDRYNGGKRPGNPDEWQRFLGGLPRSERDRQWPGMHRDLIPAYEMLDEIAKASAATIGLWNPVSSRHEKPGPGTGDISASQTPLSVEEASNPLVSAEAARYIAVKDGPNGADVTDLSPEILATYPHIEAVWAEYADVEPVITSGRDGHADRPDSHHHTGNAVDVRANNISDETAQKIAVALQQRLGRKYYVEFEHFPATPAKDHVHIEYDPR